MTTTVNGGLIRITGEGIDAGREEPAVKQVVPAARDRDQSTAGWDPYEVWRTRVKEPRVAHDDSATSKPDSHR